MDTGRHGIRQLGVLSVAIVLGMAPWFAATVVSGPMAIELKLTSSAETWLTLAVQLGFVAGSAASAILLLSDRFSARRLAAASAAVAALATLGLCLPGLRAPGAITLRLVTGAALAGVYPPGIKIAAGWTRSHRGTAIGVLVGALTLGSASPHLVRVFLQLDAWRPVLVAAAASAGAGTAVFALLAREGPYQAPSSPFDPRALGRVLRERSVVLATGGYLGHMWELYAMWSTIGLFLAEIAQRRAIPSMVAPALAFLTIALGSVGCVVAGVWADRIGRSRVTIISMAVSGTCALAVGLVSHGPFLATAVVCLLWGFAIVADSAQFSACVTELAPRQYVGTAVTVQTALGFLLTMLSIRLVPTWAARWTWTWAYVPLAAGPLFGIVAMWRLWRERHI
jgi:MFS family permease